LCGNFDVDRLTGRRPVLFLAHRNFRPLDTLYCLADFVEIHARRLPVAFSELDKGHRYLSKVRTCLKALIEGIFTRPDGDVGNYRLYKRVVVAQRLDDAVLHYPRDGISDHLVRPDRHADKGVNKVGTTVREEYNRWLPDHRKHNRKDEECEHTGENTCGSPAFKAPAYHALIASLDARPNAGLKTFDHALEIEMVQAIKAIEEYREVAYAKRSTRVRDERDCSKDYCRGFKPSRNLRPAAIRSVRLHEVGSKDRVDDIRHEQRSKERNDEGHG